MWLYYFQIPGQKEKGFLAVLGVYKIVLFGKYVLLKTSLLFIFVVH